MYLFRYTNRRTAADEVDMKNVGFEDRVLTKIVFLKKKL